MEIETKEQDPTTADTGEAGELRPMARGTCVGRYLIADVLGQGGMGVVYRAFDPDLNRPVALKMMKIMRQPGQNTDDCTADRSRLLREAQALAQLSHPNVVTVHDVGTFEDVVFLAMELVEGQTLRQWLTQQNPSADEKLTALMAAGRGLAAAHQVGIIHRDFKPDNVIIGSDGRVRVLDFGLARAADLSPSESQLPLSEESEDWPEAGELSADRSGSVNFLSSDLTAAGAVMGTRNYMAPEQFEAGALDARTDQFAFAVVLFEALQGFRPFQAKSNRLLVRRMKVGRVEQSQDQRVPNWIMQVLLRGLAGDPAQRYGSMSEIIEALANDPTQARRARRAARRKKLSIVAGLMVFVGSLIFGLWYGMTKGSRLCRAAENRMQGVWDDEIKDGIEAKFLATGRPYARDTSQRVSERLDRYAQAWVGMRTEACEATHVHGEQSAAMLDRRMQCLNRRLAELKALTKLFGKKTDVGLLDRAVAVTIALPHLDRCADTESLNAAVPLPRDPKLRARIAHWQARLEDAAALGGAAKYQAALELAEAIVKETVSVSYAPIRARSLYLQGTQQAALGQTQPAGQSLQQAIETAAVAKDDDLMVDAAIALIFNLGNKQARHAEALMLSKMVGAQVTRIGGRPDLRADLLNQQGNILNEQGEYRQAQVVLTRALTLQQEHFGPDHLNAATTRNTLALVLKKMGRYREAQEHYQQALATYQKVLGPAHPDVAMCMTNLAWVLRMQDQQSQAMALYRKSLRIFEDAFGSQHEKVAAVLTNLASALQESEEPGHQEQARQYYLRALQITETVLGPAHPKVSVVLVNLGLLDNDTHQYQRALTTCQRGLAIAGKSLGPQHPMVGHQLHCIAEAHLGLGRPAEAIAPLTRALALFEAKAIDPNHVAVVMFLLARARWQTGQQGTAALALAERARTLLSQTQESSPVDLDQIEAWIAERRPVAR